MADRPSRFEDGTWNGRVAHFHKERVVVALKTSVGLADIAPTISSIIATIPGGDVLVHRDGQRWFVSRVRVGESIPAVARDVATRHAAVVEFAEPDLRVRGTMPHPWPPRLLRRRRSAWWRPWWLLQPLLEILTWVTSTVRDVNDPLAQDNWALGEISATRAWWFLQGDPKTLVAVIDSGIAIKSGSGTVSHPDLDTARFILEHMGPFGIKPLNNYIDAEIDQAPADTHGHGTHVTGIIAARADNDQGSAGINWESPVYIARVLDQDKAFDPEVSGSASDVLVAVFDLLVYATSYPHVFERIVVNLSLADDREATSESMKLLCDITAVFNVVLCCGVASSLTGGISRPAALAGQYRHVIAVSAIRPPEAGVVKRTIFPEVMAKRMILAPGWKVWSTVPGYLATPLPGTDPSGYYALMSGSSMATPFVSGVVSLLWASNPLLSPAQIWESLRNTASMVSADYVRDDGTVDTAEFPLLHAGRALEKCYWALVPETTRLDFDGVAVGATMTIRFVLHVFSVCTLSFSATSDNAEFVVRVVPAQYDPLTMGTSYSGVAVAFQGTVSDAVTTATLAVKCADSGDEWSIPLRATTT